MIITGQTPLSVVDESRPSVPSRELEANHRYEIARDGAGAGFVFRDLDAGGVERRLRGPIRVDAQTAGSGIRVAEPLGSRYRGSMRMVAVGASAFEVVNELGVEGYLRGVLAGEVPTGWGEQAPVALSAGAVTYRTRTFARLRGRGFSWDVTSDSPIYLGLDGERDATSRAVERTAGLMMLAGKRPFEASFPVSSTAPTVPVSADPGTPSAVAQKAPSREIPGAQPGLGANAADAALSHIGLSYKWGGSKPSEGFDCSGLVSYVFAQLGIALPRVAEEQAKVGVYVPKAQLLPGDAVFFADSSGYVHHEGLYIGNGRMVHAPQTGDKVKITDITTGYYARQYAGARRYSPAVGASATR